MNIKNMNKVIVLKKNLDQAISHHKASMALTIPLGGRFNQNARAYITLGGDEYGNHSFAKMDVQIISSPEMIAACRKLQSDAWGKVVGLRAELRSLGVTLEGDKLAKLKKAEA